MKTVYSKPNCPGCVALKNRLKAQGEEFKEVVIGVDIEVDAFFMLYPDVRSVPFVVESVPFVVESVPFVVED